MRSPTTLVESQVESSSEFRTHPDVNDRIVAAVAHGQPMEEEPEDGHKALVVDLGVLVPNKRGHVER